MKKKINIDIRRELPQLLRDYALVTLGSLLAGVSFNMFFLPYDIAPGGVTGIATVLARFLPLGVGLISFLINLPLFLLGWRSVGWRFAVRSFYGMTMLSAFIDLLPSCDLTGEVLLASGFGGILLGVGLGLVVRGGATTGGTDMAAKLVSQLAGFLSIPSILFAIDTLVVCLASAVFGLQAGFYALVSLYAASKAMDAVIRGVNTAMQYLIITREREEISRRILHELDRGCTLLSARGGYSGEEVGSVLCVVPRLEAPRLKKIVAETDPRAFVTVCNVAEALGEGFSGIGQD